MAYDTMFGGKGWGLWWPQHNHFVERLVHRAERSSSYRLLLTLVCHGLMPAQIFSMRLLFRRMDEDGTGMISHATFRSVCGRVCEGMVHTMSDKIVDALFVAADLYEQKCLDFKNLVMLFIDLDTFTDAMLLEEIRSMLNRLRGPMREFKASTDPCYDPFLESYLVNQDSFLDDLKNPKVNPGALVGGDSCIIKSLFNEIEVKSGVRDIEASTILRVLREELI